MLISVKIQELTMLVLSCSQIANLPRKIAKNAEKSVDHTIQHDNVRAEYMDDLARFGQNK